MRKVARDDILDLQRYEERRPALRERVLEQKRVRRVELGDALTFLFECFETVHYQIQEMLRTERIVSDEGILHEIDTYNELLGEQGELGCTLLIGIADPMERDRKLREWLPLPEHLYVRLEDGRQVRASYDPRQVGTERLSSVQYLKFACGGKAPVAIGCDLAALTQEVVLTDEQRAALEHDLST